MSIKDCPRVPITDVLSFIVDNRGKTVPTSETGFPLIATNCVLNEHLYPVFDKIRYVSDETLNTWFRAHLQPNDILFVNKGTPGRCCLVPNPVTFCAAQDMIGLRCDSRKIYYRYLLMVLRSPELQKMISNNHVGLAIPHFKKENLPQLMIPLPEMNEQIALGDLYFRFCDAIENNNTICSNLEAMAKLLYDYWFVQFDFPDENGKPYKSSGGKMVWNDELNREIPDGWEAGTVLDMGEVVGGATPSTDNPDYYSDDGIAWATPKDLSDSDNIFFTHGDRDISEQGLNSCSAVLMPKGTVLMTSRAPIGYLSIAANDVCTNQGFKSIIPRNDFGPYYVFYTLKLMMPYIKRYGVGSTFAEVSKQDVEGIKVVIPDKSTVKKFHSKVNSIFEAILELEVESQQLASLRDFLLPMLMSGQVKVGV